MTVRGLTAIGLLAATAIAGCGGSDSGSSDSGAAAPAPAAPKGSVRFVAPQNGAATGSTLHAKVALKNFRISAVSVGQAPRPGVGHLHFIMDGGKFDHPRYSGKNGLLGKKLGVTGKYSPALAPGITYTHLPAGKHVLEVDLANNNHTNVGVDAKLDFRVK
jgi:hypothetical protein